MAIPIKYQPNPPKKIMPKPHIHCVHCASFILKGGTVQHRNTWIAYCLTSADYQAAAGDTYAAAIHAFIVKNGR